MRNYVRLLIGVVGVLELLCPHKAVALWTRLVYRDGVDAEPREWVYGAARLEGAVLALLALRSLFRAAESTDGGDALPTPAVEGAGDE